MCSQEKRLRTCLSSRVLTMKFTSRMTRHLLIATSTTLCTELSLLREFLDDMAQKGYLIVAITRRCPSSLCEKKDGTL